jgi:hypothetical protein
MSPFGYWFLSTPFSPFFLSHYYFIFVLLCFFVSLKMNFYIFTRMGKCSSWMARSGIELFGTFFFPLWFGFCSMQDVLHKSHTFCVWESHVQDIYDSFYLYLWLTFVFEYFHVMQEVNLVFLPFVPFSNAHNGISFSILGAVERKVWLSCLFAFFFLVFVNSFQSINRSMMTRSFLLLDMMWG